MVDGDSGGCMGVQSEVISTQEVLEGQFGALMDQGLGIWTNHPGWADENAVRREHHHGAIIWFC